MRIITTGLTAAAIALTLAACGKKDEAAPSAETAAEPAAAASTGGNDTLPPRKPGLWEQVVNGTDGSSATIKICLDPATDAKLSVAGQQQAEGMCSENTMKRQLNGSYVFASTCTDPRGAVVKAAGAATGDFNSSYTVDTTMVTTLAGAAPITQSVKVTAKWLGACPEGWIPGDMETGGMRVNMTGGAAK